MFLDSALVVNTVNGDWKLEPEHLKDLCAMACVLVKEFANFKMCWGPRGMNVEADALASRALGRGRARGAERDVSDGRMKRRSCGGSRNAV